MYVSYSAQLWLLKWMNFKKWWPRRDPKHSTFSESQRVKYIFFLFNCSNSQDEFKVLLHVSSYSRTEKKKYKFLFIFADTILGALHKRKCIRDCCFDHRWNYSHHNVQRWKSEMDFLWLKLYLFHDSSFKDQIFLTFSFVHIGYVHKSIFFSHYKDTLWIYSSISCEY